MWAYRWPGENSNHFDERGGLERRRRPLGHLTSAELRYFDAHQEPPEFIAQGERVVVASFAAGRIKATNKTFEDHWVFAITVRNGKFERRPTPERLHADNVFLHSIRFALQRFFH